MLKRNFLFLNFQKNVLNGKDKKKVLKNLKVILKENSYIIRSLSDNYKNKYSKKQIVKYKKKFSDFRVIGMGGSIFGPSYI